MDLKETLNGYFQRTQIPPELLPEKATAFIKQKEAPKAPAPKPETTPAPAPSEHTEAETDASAVKAEKPAIGASAFIKVVRHHHLTGKEFLRILGNSKISNKAYQEIEGNPGLTVKRLIEILEESSLTTEDYEKLIIAAQQTARRRDAEKEAKAAAAQKEAEEPAPAPVSKPAPAPVQPKAPEPADKPAEPPTQEIKPLPPPAAKEEAPAEKAEEKEKNSPESIKPEVQKTDETPAAEAPAVPTEGSGRSPVRIDLDDDDDDEEDDENDDDEDDEKKPRSNKKLFIIVAVAAVALLALSFGIRYAISGSLFPQGESSEIPQVQQLDSEGIYNALSVLPAQNVPAFTADRTYKAGLSDDESPFVSSVVTDNRLIFMTEDTIYFFSRDKGELKQLDARRYSEDIKLLGLLETEGGAAVVSEYGGESFSFSIPADEENGVEAYEGEVTRPETVIELLDKSEPENLSKMKKYAFSGTLAGIWASGGRISLASWEGVPEGSKAAESASFLPYCINPDKYKAVCSAENVFVPAEPSCGGFVGIYSISLSDGKVSLAAAAGAQGQLVYAHENNIFILQDSSLIKYDVSDGVKQVGNASVEGTAAAFSAMNVSGDNLLVTASENGSSALSVFDAELNTVMTVKEVGSGEEVIATCFDGSSAYLVCQSGTVYGIDGEGNIIGESPAVLSKNSVYRFSDGVGICVSPSGTDEKRTGLILSSFGKDGSLISQTEISSKTVAQNALDEYLSSPAETAPQTIGGSSEEGIAVIPVIYFDGVSQVERFVLCSVSENGELSLAGSISEYDRHSSVLLAEVADGVIYAVSDVRIITAEASDGSIINYFSVTAPEGEYSYVN